MHDKLTVFFDGACPLCRREIAWYRRRAAADRIAWVDVSDVPPDVDVTPGLRACDALARFHVRSERGELVSGAAAFLAIWRRMGGALGAAARVLSLPPLPRLLDAAYRAFLAVRPRRAARRLSGS